MVLPIELRVVQRVLSRFLSAGAFLFLAALLILLLLTFQVDAFSAEPEGVRLYLPQGADPSTTVGVLWTTDNATMVSNVEYGLDTELGLSILGTSSHLQGSTWQGRLHQVQLTALSPETTYHYRVGDDSGNTSAIHSFTTLPDPYASTPSNPMTLGLFGSMGTGPGAEDLTVALAEAGLDVLVSPGGLAGAPGDDHAAWERWGRLASNFSAQSLLLAGAGGGDMNGSAMAEDWARKRLPPLSDTGWYEARLGGIQLLVLDSTADLSPGSAQSRWLETRLAAGWDQANVSWRLITHYRPLYSSGLAYGSNATLQGYLEPLLVDYPGTLLVSAADNHYQRSRPLENGSVRDSAANATVQLLVGHGGQGLGRLEEPSPAWSLMADNGSVGYLRLTLLPNGTLEGEALNTQGQVIDAFWFELPDIELNEVSAPEYVVEGEPVQLNGTTPDPDARLRWVSDLQGPVLEQGTGLVWLANGTHRLSLQGRWPDSSWSTAWTFNTTVNGRPRARILSATTLVQEGALADLSGQGSDDGELAGYEWRSARDGLLSIAAAFTTSSLSNGSHNLSFWVLDEYWEWSAPASVQVRVNGQPVVTRPTPGASQMLRGGSSMVTFGGHDDVTTNENLTPELAYRDPDGFLRTSHLGPLVLNASAGVWEALFAPPYTAIPGTYTFFGHLSDDEGGNSGWRPGPSLTLLNNRPTTLFLGGDPSWLMPGQPVIVWAQGTDLEDDASVLEPTLEYSIAGAGDWTPATSQNWTWNLSGRVHELWFTPPGETLPAIYDIRVGHNDSDGGASDRLALASAIRVLEVRSGSLTPSVQRTAKASVWANLSHYDCQTLEVQFLHRPLSGGPWTNASLSGQYYDLDLAAWRVNFTPPAEAMLGPYQFTVTFHNASSNITSRPVIALLLEVLNNPPLVLGLEPVEGPQARIQREGSIIFWTNGTDVEDPLSSLTPRIQYRLNGTRDNWSETGIGVAAFNTPDQRWEVAYAPDPVSRLGRYDLRANFRDPDSVLSQWLVIDQAFEVTNRPPLVSNLSADREFIFRNGTLTLNAIVDDEGPALLNATFQVRPQGAVDWISDWMDQPIYLDGQWQVNLSSPGSAELGLYSARVAMTDPDGGASDWFSMDELFRLNNTPPHLQGYRFYNSTVLRDSDLMVLIEAHDHETPALSLLTRLEYRPHGTNGSWVWAPIAEQHLAPKGYNVTWYLPADVGLGNYSLRAQITDGDGDASEWWEAEGPAFEALNNRPEVLNVTFHRTQVYREQAALLQVQTRDRDHPASQLLLNVTYGPTGSDPFTAQWLTEPAWNSLGGGLWETTFFPATNAVLGNYTFRFQLTDPDNGTSPPYIIHSAIEVLNNPPQVANFSLDVLEVLRGNTVIIVLNGSDAESIPRGLTTQFGYLDGETLRPLSWQVNETDIGRVGGGRGEPSLYQQEVFVPLSADLGSMELYARLVDDEGGISSWWGPVNLSVRNNQPRIWMVNLTSEVTRTLEATLQVNGTDLETPDPALGLTLRMTPENGSSASYYPLQKVTFDPDLGVHQATFTVAATWPMGNYRVNLTLEDGEGGRAWPAAVVPFQVLNKVPEILQVSVEQEQGDLIFVAEGQDSDGEIVEYRWGLKNSSLLGREAQFTMKAFNVGGGERTFVVVAVDNDGGLSESHEVTFRVDAPIVGANSNKPWITARLIGAIMVVGLLTMVVGGATARAHNATLRELAKMPSHLVEEAFLVNWEGRPVAHASRDESQGGGGVDPALAREVLDSAREMVSARPGQLGYLGPWQLELGSTMLLMTGRHHFLALICQGRPPQTLREAAEDLLRQFEGRTAFVDGQMVKIGPDERMALTSELATLLDPSRAITPRQLKARLTLRQVELDTSLVARRGRLLWQVKVVNNGRFDLNRGVIQLSWDQKLAQGPVGNRVELPLIAHSRTETFLFPLEPQAMGEGTCTGKLGYHIPGRWELMELEPKTMRTSMSRLTIINDVARAHRLLEGERGDRLSIDFPLPELIKGEMVAQRARSALHHMGLRPLPELILEPDPTGPAIVEDSVWGGQDAHGEQLVAWLSLRHTTMAVELVAERPITLVQGVASFREQFREQLGEIYELLEGQQ